jgi:hypothetical protein
MPKNIDISKSLHIIPVGHQKHVQVHQDDSGKYHGSFKGFNVSHEGFNSPEEALMGVQDHIVGKSKAGINLSDPAARRREIVAYGDRYIDRSDNPDIQKIFNGWRQGVALLSEADLTLDTEQAIRKAVKLGDTTTKAAAAAAGLTDARIRQKAEAGEIPGATKPGHDWVIPEGAVKKEEEADEEVRKNQTPRRFNKKAKLSEEGPAPRAKGMIPYVYTPESLASQLTEKFGDKGKAMEHAKQREQEELGRGNHWQAEHWRKTQSHLD